MFFSLFGALVILHRCDFVFNICQVFGKFKGKLPGFCIPGKGELLFKYGLKSPLLAHFPGRFVYGDDIALATLHKDLAQSVTAPTDGLNSHKAFLTTKRTNP